MNHTAENNAVPLRTRLKERRAAQNPIDRNRGALLIRGRLFTWLATTRARLRQAGQPVPGNIAAFRSEEHTSELQSLMRISYAVFCFKTYKHSTSIIVLYEQ